MEDDTVSNRLEFKNKLQGILKLAEENGKQITLSEITEYFEEDHLDEDQMKLVCEYLLSQKIAVRGYKEPEDSEEEREALSEEEQKYVEAYQEEIRGMKAVSEEEARMSAYFPKVVEEALKLKHSQVFIGDVIQEGNVSLMLALKEMPQEQEEVILEAVRAGMRALIEEQTEVKRQDKKMVEQVSDLDASIRSMTEELGRKVSVDELAEKLGIKEEQIAEILKLAGEEVED